jgi:hypothetical protein
MGVLIHNPPNKLHIDAIWVFVSSDKDGNEGVIAIETAAGMMPLIAADEDRLKSLRPIAKQVAAGRAATGKEVKLIKFTMREELETITP